MQRGSNRMKGTIHAYFAGGSLDGELRSLQDPETIIRYKVDVDLVHVYQLQSVEEPDERTQSAMRGKQAVYVFTGPEYIFEEE